jgi:hypothetical protein
MAIAAPLFYGYVVTWVNLLCFFALLIEVGVVRALPDPRPRRVPGDQHPAQRALARMIGGSVLVTLLTQSALGSSACRRLDRGGLLLDVRPACATRSTARFLVNGFPLPLTARRPPGPLTARRITAGADRAAHAAGTADRAGRHTTARVELECLATPVRAAGHRVRARTGRRDRRTRPLAARSRPADLLPVPRHGRSAAPPGAWTYLDLARDPARGYGRPDGATRALGVSLAARRAVRAAGRPTRAGFERVVFFLPAVLDKAGRGRQGGCRCSTPC